MTTELTVIVPVLNEAAYIEATLRSIAEQNYLYTFWGAVQIDQLYSCL